MKHKAIFILFIIAFCIILLGSIVYTLAQVIRRQAEIGASYRGVSLSNTADELSNANIMTLAARILTILGAFPLTVASATGAWTIEDKYVKLGMLIFCAIITSFLLAPNIFTLTI
jgi:hypothetical protein